MTDWIKSPHAKGFSRDVLEDPYNLASTATPSGRALDALVAEKVMGENLTPPRSWALMIVGMSLTSVTGKDWKLRNGKTIYMPNGDDLPQPEGATDYNARYYAYAAEHSGEDVDALVAKVRNTPKPYSTDIAAAWLVVEKLNEHFHAVIKSPFTPDECYIAGFTPHGATGWNGRPDHQGIADTAPLAICRAALAAVDRGA